MRAKFHVHAVVPTSTGGETIYAHPVYGPENKSWALATPAGQLMMTISNPAALGSLEPGADYFLDFTLAEPGA